MEQMVAHHTFGGCNLQPGDLLGTGTISCGVGTHLHVPPFHDRADSYDALIAAGYCISMALSVKNRRAVTCAMQLAASNHVPQLLPTGSKAPSRLQQLLLLFRLKRVLGAF